MLTEAGRTAFAEYVDPVTGTPRGARHFSWTAALALDLLCDPGTPGTPDTPVP
ncbi:Trehalase OS=Streptomyces fumanus OX=67302 GN=GCM10018772_18930 PE=3 SV=1 [Streptomyces fumanus]